MKKSFGYRQSESTCDLIRALESTQSQAALAGTDIETHLDALDVQRGAVEGWRTSVSALLATLGCHSAPKQRRALANDFGFTGNPEAMGTLGIWLHGELMRRLRAPPGVSEASSL